MVIRRSTSGEVARLIGDLADGDQARRDAAVARLSVIGARAVDRLLAALEAVRHDATTIPQQEAMLQTLERIGDARAVDSALAILAGGPAALHSAAIGVLRVHVQSRRNALATRVLEALTGVVLDTRRPEVVRLAALEAVQDLPGRLVAPLMDQLSRDGSPVLRRHAGAERPSGPRGRGGKPSGPSPDLERLLDTLPADPVGVDELVAASGADAPLLVLHRLVVAVRAREDQSAHAEERARWRVVRAAVHQALGARRSRVALYDLRETVATTKAPLPIGMLAALVAVGDATCLEPIAGAYQRIDDAWHRERLAEALRAIVARERLTRRHAAFRKLAARLPEFVVP